mmetsp:Transcript_7592/g.31436  ORF Transcript_7592/g.31436 Transcript_7592/m.31436 type:complete len:242 (-) Transcript_7592:553-1278(-)
MVGGLGRVRVGVGRDVDGVSRFERLDVDDAPRCRRCTLLRGTCAAEEDVVERANERVARAAVVREVVLREGEVGEVGLGAELGLVGRREGGRGGEIEACRVVVGLRRERVVRGEPSVAEVPRRDEVVARVAGLEVEVAREHVGHAPREGVYPLRHERRVHEHDLLLGDRPEEAGHVVRRDDERRRLGAASELGRDEDVLPSQGLLPRVQRRRRRRIGGETPATPPQRVDEETLEKRADDAE